MNIILRIKSILIFILMGLSAHSSLHFTYSIDGERGSERTWVKIKQNLINQNGWNWYVDNFISKNCILEISLIKDTDRYGMLIATWPEQDKDFYNKLARSVNTLAQDNDTILIDRLHYALTSLPPGMRLNDIPPDIDSLIIKEQQEKLEYCINEFLFCYSVWHGIWYNVFPMSDQSLCQNLFYKGFYLNNNSAFISDTKIRAEYIKECDNKKIRCLIGDKPTISADSYISHEQNDSVSTVRAAMELLHKYVIKDDSLTLSYPLPEKRHIMEFIFEPVDADCDNTLTNLK